MTFYWYDFETFGTQPASDRPSQFAGLRTDDDFKIIDQPLVLYCKPARDVLPQPEACLITGITPQLADEKGLPEAAFIKKILHEFSQPDTCVTGFNNIRFDDEVTRHCLYRNFYDPYAREWQNGNSRWDILDLLRATRLLRPEGINWPNREDGSPSFKLEHLTSANGIDQTGAHDALVDVYATINIARLVKRKQPQFFDYVLQNKSKQAVGQQLNVQSKKPVLHVSSKYPAEKGCGAIVLPLARDQLNKNATYVYDLSVDPEPLLTLSADELRARIFTASSELPEGQERVPLKAVHANKCPIVVPVSVVTPEVAERLTIDLQQCRANMDRILQAQGLTEKVEEIFSQRQFEPREDPDHMLYSGGFFSSRDRQLMDKVPATPPEKLADLTLPFHDQRLPEMLFRYRARNYPDTLNAGELSKWEDYRLNRITQSDGGGSITLEEYDRQIAEKMADPECSGKDQAILNALKDYRAQLLGH
jgi:exodeoxyribonuclease-1